jgi:hypothetical protein
MRIVLDEKDLLRLLAGRIIEKQTKSSHVEVCLKDLGWAVFQETLDKARGGDIRIPCDPGCEAERGHPGACWLGGKPEPHMKGDEIPTRDAVRKPDTTVPVGEHAKPENTPPARPLRRVLPPVRRRDREK